jgi:hypothetical protein
VRQHLVRFKEILCGDNCILNYQLETFQGIIFNNLNNLQVDMAELNEANLTK